MVGQHREVRNLIVVVVSNRDCHRIGISSVEPRVLPVNVEHAGAISEEDRDRITISVDGDDIDVAVAIEVPGTDRHRSSANIEGVGPSAEATAAIVQEDVHFVGQRTDSDDVRAVVLIHINQRNRLCKVRIDIYGEMITLPEGDGGSNSRGRKRQQEETEGGSPEAG